MSVYLHTIVALVTIYSCVSWGRYMTRGQIALRLQKTLYR